MGESSVPSTQPSSRLKLFTKKSSRAFSGRATITQKPSTRVLHVAPPRKDSPRWRPSVLGSFGPVELVAPAASQTSIQPPPSDSNYTPIRPSLSSSVDASHTNTLLTVPSIEITPPVEPVLPLPHFFQQHNQDFSSLTSPAASSSSSFFRVVHPGNTTTQIATPALGERERETGHYPRMYPYGNGVKTNAGGGFEYNVDDVEKLVTRGSDCLHAPQIHALSSDQQYPHLDPQLVHQTCQSQQQRSLGHDTKKKADVLYTSASSHSGSGGTLSKMASYYLAQLSTISMRNKKKKKRLILSGIAADDTKKLKSVKRWCEVGLFWLFWLTLSDLVLLEFWRGATDPAYA